MAQDQAKLFLFRFALTSIAIPANTRIAPRTAQRLCPDMKLPGITLIPCSTHIVPKSISTTPTMFNTIFTMPPFA
jgi:hypothetical protein